MLDENNPPAIIGEAVAGQAAKRAQSIRAEIRGLDKLVVDSTFDIAERLAEVKGACYYGAWGYQTFADYVETELDMKVRKAQYLVRIVNIAKQLGIERVQYEKIKITKLREIFTLEPTDFFWNETTQHNEPIHAHIVRLVDEANGMTLEQVVEEVARLKGLTGDDALVWINTKVKRIVLEEVILPAREKARLLLGSQSQSAGEATEYSDGACEEVIHAEFLNGFQLEEQQFEDNRLPEFDPNDEPQEQV